MITSTESLESDEPPNKYCFPDVRFLKSGYFSIVTDEILEKNTTLSARKSKNFLTTNTLDFFCVPVLLERAKKQGIHVAEFHITTQFDFELPAIIYPINPFMYNPRIVRNRKRINQAMISLTRNHTYPVCAEPFHGKLKKEIVVFGKTKNEKVNKITTKLWKTFRIPLFVCYFFEAKNGVWLSGAVPVATTGYKLNDVAVSKKWQE